MLGRQPVIDGHHDRLGTHRMLAGGAIMGVEIADDEPAAVEEHHDWQLAVTGIDWRPIDSDSDGTGRPVDGAVLDVQFGVHRPARQVAEPLAGSVDAVVGG
jgi:hypothetical protein